MLDIVWRRTMTKRIFRAIFLAAASVLIAAIVLIMGVLYSYFDSIRKETLKTELYLAADAVETGGIDYLESVNISKNRLTWIDKDGKVLFDSKSNSEEMENHLEREEIQEAFDKGEGSSQRYSDTIMEKTLYHAIRLDDGTVLRISVSQAAVPLLLLGLAQPIIIVFIIAMVISFFLASRLSKRIIGPLIELDLDYPLENDSYDELSPLLSRISNQQKKIRIQENELSQRKNEFLAITSNMNEGLILLGSDKKILSLNPAAESFLSSEDECVGKAFIETERNQNIISALHKAESDDSGEVQIKRNGRICQLNISGIRDTGKLMGFVILIFDITERINAESRRREFTANVSHELKTPLQSIMGSAELIENGIVKKEDMPEFIGRIRSESARLVTLIDDIIRLSQLDEGVDLPGQEVDLYALAEECIEELRPQAEKKNVSLHIHGGRSVVQSVPSLISEIIYNLLDNAIKYNVDGGKADVTISEGKITVADTGIGIPAEHQERIFERFYRVDKSHSRETGGTGLGLAIVKHAAEEIGAEISLESRPGKGTEIELRFK